MSWNFNFIPENFEIKPTLGKCSGNVEEFLIFKQFEI